MAKKPKIVRQKQIAEELNLSVGTVSKAFSNYTDINEQTRAKVINAASKMGYKFDTRSRKALAGKSYFVGVLIYGQELFCRGADLRLLRRLATYDVLCGDERKMRQDECFVSASLRKCSRL